MVQPVSTLTSDSTAGGGSETARLTQANLTLAFRGRNAWLAPLPELRSRQARIAGRLVLASVGNRIQGIVGAQHLFHRDKPFIAAVNHSQRTEALLIPALLTALRRGRLVHFMADWNFLFLPVVGTIIRLSQPIIVVRKDLKPRFLNFLKPRFQQAVSPFEQARELLSSGQSVGIFPEGTVNRNREALLRGHLGAARLSLQSGVPILPLGLRFEAGHRSTPISDLECFTLHLGSPLDPGAPNPDPAPARVREWHAEMMQAISRLSGKQWTPNNPRTKYANNRTP
ncbi:MAG TPA: lysophospholipid acyltransferase family protein [Candidatus Limnocylindria bacterium]|nr:lysophospholipid acyltransferase family protein [Candidatus Limnocylindria bacterium]